MQEKAVNGALPSSSRNVGCIGRLKSVHYSAQIECHYSKALMMKSRGTHRKKEVCAPKSENKKTKGSGFIRPSREQVVTNLQDPQSCPLLSIPYPVLVHQIFWVWVVTNS